MKVYGLGLTHQHTARVSIQLVMAEQTSIALNFHLNLNHRALQPVQRERFLRQDLGELAASIAVPTTISACAEDMLVVRNSAPESWDAIVDNPHVYIAPSFYSHALAELFPQEVVDNAQLGDYIIRMLLPDEKVIPFGYPPELSAPPLDTVQALSDVWQGTIFSDIRVQSQHANESLPPAFVTPEGLEYHAAIRKLGWRKTLHAYLRGVADSSVIIDALHADSERYTGSGPLVTLLDLETPILNENWDGTQNTSPSTALFAKLQRDLRRSTLRFSVLGDDTYNGKMPMADAPVAAENAVNRWNQQDLVCSVGPYASTHGYRRMLFLSSLCSDYFMLPEEDLLLPTRFDGKDGEMCMRNDGEARTSELAAKLSALEQGRMLGEVIPRDADPFLHMTHHAIEQASALSALALTHA